MRYYQGSKRRTPTAPKPPMENKIKVRAALRRERLLGQQQRDSLHGRLAPIPFDVLQQVRDDVMGLTDTSAYEAGFNDLSEDDNPRNVNKKKARRSVKETLSKEVEKMSAEALMNTETLPYFNFYQKSRSRRKAQPTIPCKTIEHDLPWTLASSDGVHLLHYLPKLIKDRAQALLTEAILEYAAINKQNTKNWKSGDLVELPGQYVGHTAIVRSWHGIGRTDLAPTPSTALLKNGRSFVSGCQIISDLSLLSHRVNELLRCLDPTLYANLKTLRDKMEAEPALAALHRIDPLLMEGREILFNTKKGVHIDRHDPELGWAVLVALGSFKGGYVHMPKLGYRVRLEPGDVVLLRGRVVEHEIESFEGGPRINVPHFTHRSLWAAHNLEHLVNPFIG